MQREIKKNILSTSRFFFLPAAAFFLLSVDISPGCEIVQTIFDNCRNCINYRSELSVLYSYQSHSYQSEVSSNVDSGTFNLFVLPAKNNKKNILFLKPPHKMIINNQKAWEIYPSGSLLVDREMNSRSIIHHSIDVESSGIM